MRNSIHDLPACVWRRKPPPQKTITSLELGITVEEVEESLMHIVLIKPTCNPQSQGSCPGWKDAKAAETFEGKADKRPTFKGSGEKPAVCYTRMR